jgi:hypothetical protein
MRRLLPAAALLLVSSVAAAQAPEEEEDDPGFARRKPPAPPPAVEDEEPTPDPVPFTEEDPGLADQVTVRVATPRKRVRRAPGLVELGWRVTYRTLTNKEIIDETGTMYAEDRFHVIGFDAYPISGPVRVGLSLQGGMEMGDKDRFATVGIVVGFQQRRPSFTPWIEGGIHVGPARRDFWYMDQPVPEPELTFLWAFAVEVGVDARLGKAGPIGSVAIGLQRTSYYSTRGDADDPLFPVNDGTVTLKVGIGY